METRTVFGAPHWVDLATPDVLGSSRFYEALFGWQITRHRSPVGDHYLCAVDGHDVAGMMETPPHAVGTPGMWTVLFRVADVDATVRASQAAGGQTLDPPFDLPDARVAMVADPTGASFGLISHLGPRRRWQPDAPGGVA